MTQDEKILLLLANSADPTTNYFINPSFETGTGGLSKGNAGMTLTKIDGDGVFGNSCLQITNVAAADARLYVDTAVTNGSDPLYDSIVSCWAKAGTHNKLCFELSATTSPVFTLTNEWVRYSFVKVGVQVKRPYIYAKTPFSGETGTIFVEGLQYEIRPTGLAVPSIYCDGTQENCKWNGTPHASTSTRS